MTEALFDDSSRAANSIDRLENAILAPLRERFDNKVIVFDQSSVFRRSAVRLLNGSSARAGPRTRSPPVDVQFAIDAAKLRGCATLARRKRRIPIVKRTAATVMFIKWASGPGSPRSRGVTVALIATFRIAPRIFVMNLPICEVPTVAEIQIGKHRAFAGTLKRALHREVQVVCAKHFVCRQYRRGYVDLPPLGGITSAR